MIIVTLRVLRYTPIFKHEYNMKHFLWIKGIHSDHSSYVNALVLKVMSDITINYQQQQSSSYNDTYKVFEGSCFVQITALIRLGYN